MTAFHCRPMAIISKVRMGSFAYLATADSSCCNRLPSRLNEMAREDDTVISGLARSELTASRRPDATVKQG